MRDITIIGAGGFGREVKCLIDDINKVEKTFNILGFIDDGISPGTNIHEYKVLGGVDYLNSLEKKPCVVIAIGTPSIKQRIFNRLKKFEFPSIVHPSVSLNGTNITIEEGCILSKGCILTCDIKLGKFTILNLSCTIGHDTLIHPFSSFMPSVNISGEVTINEAVYVGTGAKIINDLNIGKNTIIGAGAVVSKSLPENCTAVGIPAKPIKFN
ncbi:MAG: acetyltransferase [Patiriisocius sp.]|uniref:acetyltransferase n=1 Tax=Patiriisocius sp. TaxID=2822396 RepID=UPI003EFB20FD